MKVVHLGFGHNERDIRILMKECTALADDGHEVVYITRGLKETGEFEYRGVRVIALERRHGFYTAWKMIRNELCRAALAENADVYHLHEPVLLGIFGRLRRTGADIVFDAHEHYKGMAEYSRPTLRDLASPRGLFLKLLGRHQWRQLRRCAPKCAAVITASDGVGDEYCGLNRRICILRNVPLLDDMSCRLEDFMQRESVFSYVGVLNEKRAISRIAEAAGELDGCRFEFAGKLPAELSALGGNGGEHHRYLGLLDRAGVDELLGRSIAGMIVLTPHPNHLEPEVSNKLFEYMTAGLPVICSNFPEWQRFIDEVGCGLCVDPLDTESIRGAMRYIAEHRAEALEMGLRGRKAVDELLNWDVEKKALTDLYSELDSRRARSGH